MRMTYGGHLPKLQNPGKKKSGQHRGPDQA